MLAKEITGTGGGCIGLIEVSDFSPAGIANFNTQFNLTAFGSAGGPTLTDVLAPGNENPGTNEREDETMLDIEYAHAFAPGASIKVYLADPGSAANPNDINASVAALTSAVNDDACTAMSISIKSCGFPDSFYTGALNTTLLQAQAQMQTVFVAEGDEGAAEFNPSDCSEYGVSPNVNELASNPLITAVGGTQFIPTYENGNDVGFVAEQAWNEMSRDSTGIASTGGGLSTVFTKPTFQTNGTPDDGQRDVPDISMEAACSTPGVFSVFPDRASGNAVKCCACGTSLGAPIWAGITELIVQTNGGGVGTLNPTLYSLGNRQDTASTGIRDVISGNNDFDNTSVNPSVEVTGFTAAAGYDLATGWGTPDLAVFVPAFLGLPVPTTTPTATSTTKPTPSRTPTPTRTPTATPTPGPAKLTITKSISFGKTTEVGDTSKPKDATVKNASPKKGGGTAIIATATTDNPLFAVTERCSPATLEPGKSCKIGVTFKPISTTAVTGHLIIDRQCGRLAADDPAIGNRQSTEGEKIARD
ncbi:MAG: S53 family peptidase [Candidatus Binataceae bacterium]